MASQTETSGGGASDADFVNSAASATEATRVVEPRYFGTTADITEETGIGDH